MPENLEDLLTIISILVGLGSIGTLAVSSLRYINARADELHQRRFENYHKIIEIVSKGEKEKEILKLVSQLSYIYELRFYKEYRSNTKAALDILIKEWSVKEDQYKISLLTKAAEETKIKLGFR